MSVCYPERLKFPGKNTPQNTFFTEQLPVASVKFQLFFKKGKKQKQFFIPPLCLIRLKSCSCIKIVKIPFIHNFEKNYSNLSSVSFNFCNIRYRSSHQRCSIKKKNTYARVYFLRTFFTEHLWTTAYQNTKTTLLAFT